MGLRCELLERQLRVLSASRWARKTTSPRRGRSSRVPARSPKRPPRSSRRGSNLLSNRPAVRRRGRSFAVAGTCRRAGLRRLGFFMPGRSSPRMASSPVWAPAGAAARGQGNGGLDGRCVRSFGRLFGCYSFCSTCAASVRPSACFAPAPPCPGWPLRRRPGPLQAASRAAMAARIFCASPVALAASSAFDASSTARSRSLRAAAAFRARRPCG